MFESRKTLQRLNKMVDAAIEGTYDIKTYQKVQYNESELSKLEAKWNRFLTKSTLSKQAIEEEKKNMKSLVSDISHQAKTPLSNIILYSEMLEEQALDENSRKYVKMIEKQSEKLNFLMQSLVKMSRLESEAIQIQPKIQPLAPLLDMVREQIALKAEKKQITIQTDYTEQEEASYDQKWTIEAIYNIVDNAVKYSKEETTISIAVKEYEMFTAICIADEGIGISEEEIPKIFARFYRSQDVQENEGIGLGLYLSRQIIMREGGYIRVRSSKGEGSTFEVYLSRK